MADPATAGGIASLITYYAPGLLAVVSPAVLWTVKTYIQPTVNAIIQLPSLLKEQNELLKTANQQRKTTATTLKENKP